MKTVRGDHPPNIEARRRMDQLRASSLAQAVSFGSKPRRDARPGGRLRIPAGGRRTPATLWIQSDGQGAVAPSRRI